MQNDIHILRRTLGWNMLEANFFAPAHKIDNQRPIEVAVAISPDHNHRRPNESQLVEDSFPANIAQVPNFVRVSRQDRQFLGKLVVRVRQNKDRLHHLCRCVGYCRS